MKKRFVILLACIVAGAIVYVVLNRRNLQIAYHGYQMQRNYDATFGTAEDLGGGFSGFRLGDSYDAYERHRDRLVEMGVIDENKYVLNYLIPGTEERRHFFGLICEGKCPGNIEVVGGREETGMPWPLTVWCWPKDTSAWDDYIKNRDTQSYTVEYMKNSPNPFETDMRTMR